MDQLAASSGVDRGTISRIELGHVSPRIDTISFLCEAMGTSLSSFFGTAEPVATAAAAPTRARQAPKAEPAPVPAGAARGGSEGYWPVPSSLWHGLLEVVDRFEALVKNSSELVLVQDREGYILYASPSCESILGLRSQELVGRHGWSILHPAELPAFEKLVDALSAQGNGTSRLDCRMRHKDGSWRWIAVKLSNQFQNPSIQALVLNGLELQGRAEPSHHL